MKISGEGIRKRDEFVFKCALETFRVPIVMLTSGGDQKQNVPVIADSIENLVNRFNLKNKGQSTTMPITEVTTKTLV